MPEWFVRILSWNCFVYFTFCFENELFFNNHRYICETATSYFFLLRNTKNNFVSSEKNNVTQHSNIFSSNLLRILCLFILHSRLTWSRRCLCCLENEIEWVIWMVQTVVRMKFFFLLLLREQYHLLGFSHLSFRCMQ